MEKKEEFEIVITPELCNRYDYIISPLSFIVAYGLLLIIPGLVMAGVTVFEIYQVTGILWLGLVLGVCVILFINYCFGSWKKIAGKSCEEKLMDLYQKKRVTGKIIFLEKSLQYSYEDKEPNIINYTSFRKCYSKKKAYILMSDQGVFLLNKPKMTKDERKQFEKMVKDKMPNIKMKLKGSGRK